MLVWSNEAYLELILSSVSAAWDIIPAVHTESWKMLNNSYYEFVWAKWDEAVGCVCGRALSLTPVRLSIVTHDH